MSRSSSLIVLAIIIALVPFSGLPHLWLAILLPAVGVVIAGIGYSLRARTVPPAEGETAAV